jgi:hypothetical protein
MTDSHSRKISQAIEQVNPQEVRWSLGGFGTAQADRAAIAAMRKSLPHWAPPDTPGHFLKHADEQLVLAVAAVDQAIRASGRDPSSFRDWAIIAAPRFIGRLAGTATLERFSRGGGPAISPHLIPQHSLHSISGALSILLASRQPNFGAGGTGNSLAEALFAALTFPLATSAGVWVISTAWHPEPEIDQQGECQNAPVCHAVALAVQTVASGATCGQLVLKATKGHVDAHQQDGSLVNAAGLCRALAALLPGGPAARFTWNLPWGATLELEAREMLAGQSAAA